jgi:3-oxoacyl-[acyl-carrier protein] reductase
VTRPSPRLPAELDLSGRTALVTGTGSPSGIGFATARLLGTLGARVAITATTERVHERASELSQLGIDTVGLVVDLTDEAAVRSVFHQARTALGPVAILVNNAGMTSQARPVLGDNILSGESGTILDIPSDAWRQTLMRNLDTTYLATRAALPDMMSARWGRVVMVASVTGPVMAMRAEAAYGASKAAMVGLMRAVALDYAGHGITCYAVAPGWIATGSQTTHEMSQAQTTPVGRAGTPEDVATAITTLCLPGAAYTTGQLLVIDGGNSIAEERV